MCAEEQIRVLEQHLVDERAEKGSALELIAQLEKNLEHLAGNTMQAELETAAALTLTLTTPGCAGGTGGGRSPSRAGRGGGRNRGRGRGRVGVGVRVALVAMGVASCLLHKLAPTIIDVLCRGLSRPVLLALSSCPMGPLVCMTLSY